MKRKTKGCGAHMSLLKCENICKSYKAGEPVLDDVSFEIARNELVSIQGVSGSGKTTLLNIIGLIDSAQSGKLYFDGHDIFAQSEQEKYKIRNRDVSIIFQKYNLFPQFNVLENIIMPVMYGGRMRLADVKDDARMLLKQLEMERFAESSINNLSGGQQQRVAIARALLLQPKLLLADEPTANVDKATEQIIMAIFQQYTKKGTVVVVSHNPVYRTISDKVFELTGGRMERA